MKINTTVPARNIFIVILCLVFVGCSGGLKLISEWRQNEINIDGNDAEWQHGLYYDQQSDMVYSIRNDAGYVYVFLKTQNRSTQMQILSSGLTVWFDSSGGKGHCIGIRYPMGRQSAQSGFRQTLGEEYMQPMFDQMFPELEIIGSNKDDVQRFSVLESPGIHVKIGRSYDALIYELQVPLKSNSNQRFAIGSVKERLSIGFETNEMKYGDNKGNPKVIGDSNDAGGIDESTIERGESEGRGEHGGQRRGYLNGKEKITSMNFWLSVQLASSPSAGR